MQKFVITGGLGLLGRRVLQHVVSTGGGRVRVMVVDTQLPDGPDSGATASLAAATTGSIVEDKPMGPSISGRDEIPITEPVDDDSGDTAKTGAAAAAVSFVSGDLGSGDVAAAIKRFANDDGDASATWSSSSSSSLSTPLSVFHLASVMSGQGEADFDEAIRVNIDGEHTCIALHTFVGVLPFDASGKQSTCAWSLQALVGVLTIVTAVLANTATITRQRESCVHACHSVIPEERA